MTQLVCHIRLATASVEVATRVYSEYTTVYHCLTPMDSRWLELEQSAFQDLQRVEGGYMRDDPTEEKFFLEKIKVGRVYSIGSCALQRIYISNITHRKLGFGLHQCRI